MTLLYHRTRLDDDVSNNLSDLFSWPVVNLTISCEKNNEILPIFLLENSIFFTKRYFKKTKSKKPQYPSCGLVFSEEKNFLGSSGHNAL